MKKDVLRKIYKEKRNNLENKSYKDNIIFNKVISNKDINSYDTLLIYVSFSSEVDTINIIKYFLDKKKVAVPKVIGNTIKFCYINSLDDLSKVKYNILEPIDNLFVTDYSNSICIVPGICYDKRKYRVGYGKGYYDRFLENKGIPTIGLCYKECITNKIDIDKTDYKVDTLITD